MTIQSVHKKLFQMFDASECIKLNQMQSHLAPLEKFQNTR